MALTNEDENAIDVVEDEFALTILAHQVVTPGCSVKDLKVAARIWITTACVVGIVLDFSPKNGLARSALNYV